MIKPTSRPHSAPGPCARAFTLIELLVVIAIIGILSSMMFVCIPAIMNKVKITRTENTAIHLRNAINSYFTEYRKYPYHSKPGDAATIRLVTDSTLMDALCASPSEIGKNGLNPRGIVFFSDRNAKPMGNGKFHSGMLIETNGSATLFDAWGEHFEVALDGDSNGRIATPEWDRNNASAEITESILVWSNGPDKEVDGEKDDNITSW